MASDYEPTATQREAVLRAQKSEITESLIYHRLAQQEKDPENASVLERLGREERAHAEFWQGYSGEAVEPNLWTVRRVTWSARTLGLTFAVKRMERGEDQAQDAYESWATPIPGARQIIEDEERHERSLIEMIDEERLRYVGSMVLGLNDALVELTGTLAGITFALQNTRLIAMTGLVTGIAASLSMAASEYLSSKSDGEEENAGKSALYTGLAYIFTVALLILPYLVLSSYVGALIWTLVNAVIIILVFTYYISVAKDLPFCKRFLEMAGISLGVAAFSFVVGIAVREVLGVDV